MIEPEKELKEYLWSQPEAKSEDVTKIFGAALTSRKVDSMEKIVTCLDAVYERNSRSSLHLNLIPASNVPFGMYIDLDPVLHAETEPVNLEATALVFNGLILEVVKEFIKHYVRALTRGIKSEIEFSALFCPRPEMGRIDKLHYKHGCHVYIGAIAALQAEHIIAFEEARQKIDQTSPAYKILRDKYRIPVEKIGNVFDENIIKQKSFLLPGCRKKGGKITYAPTRVLKFKIFPTNSEPNVGFLQDTEFTGGFREFFPIGQAIYTVESIFSAPPIEMPDVDENLAFDAELAARNDIVHCIHKLLELIPWSEFVDRNLRLRMRNALVHYADREWSIRILENLFNRENPGQEEWQTRKDIIHHVDAAIKTGQKQYLSHIKVEAARHNREEAERIAVELDGRLLVRVLKSIYNMCAKLGNTRAIHPISNSDMALIIHTIVGEDYKAVTSSDSRTWYRYDGAGISRPTCHKWQRIINPFDSIVRDTKDRISPQLLKIAKESEKNINDFPNHCPGLNFQTFIYRVVNAFGTMNFIRNSLDALGSYYVDDEFDPDRVPDHVGCLNGVIKFTANPFKATLLNENNRHLPITRSLNAKYRTDFHDDHPTVKRVEKIFRTIVPREDEYEFTRTCFAAIILSGRCEGAKCFIVFGCGADGKSTDLNAQVELAGRNNGAAYAGYGADGDPRIFQTDKVDANSHDAGSINLYGGVRIANLPEPSSTNHYLSEGAIKSHLSGSTQQRRNLREVAKPLRFCACPYILTNDQLEFRGAVTTGGQRRILVMLYAEKFKPIAEMEFYKGCPGVHPIDPTAIDAFQGDYALEMREALLWIYINKFLPKFYDQYGCNLSEIPVPERYARITKTFFGRHGDVVHEFVNAKMARDPEGIIQLDKFVEAFGEWHRRTQRASIISKVIKRDNAPSTDGPARKDPWTHSVTHMIASSPLSGAMRVRLENGDMQVITPNEIVMQNGSQLVIQGWKFL